MQRIHHQHIKKAERMGVQLVDNPEHGLVQAYWPSRNLMIFGADARYALEHMSAAIRIIEEYEAQGYKIALVHNPLEHAKVKIMLNGEWLVGSNTPTVWNTMELAEILTEDEIREYDGEASPAPRADPQFVEDPEPTIDGVPTNGRVAHRRGFAIVDAPFQDDDDGPGTHARWKWEEEWEASAEESTEAQQEAEDEEKVKTGSVVKSKFRAKYAELGHPTHCGDELAMKLNNLVANSAHTDMAAFIAILDANGVDMSKYSTSGNGWQGRYRMTGRNKLAKVIHANDGELKLPAFLHGGESLRMSADWMGSQRFKK